MTTAVVTALNGRVPTNLLTVVDAAGHQLRPDAADALARLSDAMDGGGLGPLVLSAGRSAYRTRADQQVMRALGLTTIAVGASIHGEAIAGDLSDLGGFAGARHEWLRKNAHRFGWYQPAWAREGGSLPESWHWEYDPDLDQRDNATQPTPLTEDDMLSDADRTLLTEVRDIAQNIENVCARKDDPNSIRALVQTETAEVMKIRPDINTVASELRSMRSVTDAIAARDAGAIVAAIPADIARQVADLLAARLAS